MSDYTDGRTFRSGKKIDRESSNMNNTRNFKRALREDLQDNTHQHDFRGTPDGTGIGCRDDECNYFEPNKDNTHDSELDKSNPDVREAVRQCFYDEYIETDEVDIEYFDTKEVINKLENLIHKKEIEAKVAENEEWLRFIGAAWDAEPATSNDVHKRIAELTKQLRELES